MIFRVFLLLSFIFYIVYLVRSCITKKDTMESFNVSPNRPLTMSISDQDECSPIDPLSQCKYVSFKNPCVLNENTSIAEPSLTVSGTFNICKDNYCEGKDMNTDAFLSFADLLANQSGEGVRKLAVENILASSPTPLIDKMKDLKIKTRTFKKQKQDMEEQIERAHNNIFKESEALWKRYCENTPFPTLLDTNDKRYSICRQLQSIYL